MEKICNGCKETKPLAAFYRRGNQRASRCKACFKTYYAKRWRDHKQLLQRRLVAWKRANPDKVRALHLRRYGLTHESYATLLETQRNVCALCGKPFEKSKLKKPCIDHNHKTGAVRGIIHNGCNLLIGMADEDVATLGLAVLYLQRSPK